MDRYLYLRAYMAGVVVPTVLLLFLVSAFMVARLMSHDLAPIERVLIFPLTIVPNAFGLWNMLYVAQRRRWKVPIGLHGAILPFILAPIGFTLALSLGYLRLAGGWMIWFGIVSFPTWFLGIAPLIAIAAYYLIWKYLVGFLNHVQGIE